MDPVQFPNQPEQGGSTFTPLKRYLPYLLLLFVIGNLIVINLFIFFKKDATQVIQTTALPAISGAPLPTLSAEPDFAKQMNAATESVREQILLSLSGTPSPTLTPTQTPTPSPTPRQVTHEYFVPLGTGFGSGTDWTTITQLGAMINPSNYPSLQSVVFEAEVRIPTGNQTVWVQLINATTGQAVSGSGLTLSGGTPTLLTSSPISLQAGSNLYQVQLKTQLGYTTYIDFARLRLTTDQ